MRIRLGVRFRRTAEDRFQKVESPPPVLGICEVREVRAERKTLTGRLLFQPVTELIADLDGRSHTRSIPSVDSPPRDSDGSGVRFRVPGCTAADVTRIAARRRSVAHENCTVSTDEQLDAAFRTRPPAPGRRRRVRDTTEDPFDVPTHAFRACSDVRDGPPPAWWPTIAGGPASGSAASRVVRPPRPVSRRSRSSRAPAAGTTGRQSRARGASRARRSAAGRRSRPGGRHPSPRRRRAARR